MSDDPEADRLAAEAVRAANWKRWGTYLPERQWGTVREDYSADGDAWRSFPFEQAHLRAYRWGEDGLLGWCDRQCRLCFAVALWNGRDPILKERLYGLTGHQGNHGEDCKELYYFLDATPTHSWAKALYKYPQGPFPYDELVRANGARGRDVPELELLDTGALDEDRYFDALVEYGKAGPEETLIRITVTNRGPDPAELHVLPTLWFRNVWSWGRDGEAYRDRPFLWADGADVRARSATLGTYRLRVLGAGPADWLFTDNVTNAAALWGAENERPYTRDGIARAVIAGATDATDPAREGTRAACWRRRTLQPGEAWVLHARLAPLDAPPDRDADEIDALLAQREAEADRFWATRLPGSDDEQRRVARQACAGLLWSKQFYHFVPLEWLQGDPGQPVPPAARWSGRNVDWAHHLYNRDVVSVPDTWEYPWYAAWDLAFHAVAYARFDDVFAKQQLELFLREWYLHPNGQLPAYEWNLSDVNPPVHAWASWRVFKMSGPKGQRDRRFLEHAFQKLLMNFTWWVNRKDERGRNLFTGGFLGLDNIGLFDRSGPLPVGHRLDQADGTAWMAFYCTTMLGMAIDLAQIDRAYADLASKFFEHFVAITQAANGAGGLWDERDGFYYDALRLDDGSSVPLRIRSVVGLVPLFAVLVLEDQDLERMPSFQRRMRWFLENRPELAHDIAFLEGAAGHERRLLAIPARDKLVRVLRYVLDEDEFLSPYGVRSLSKVHDAAPFSLTVGGRTYAVRYVPGDSDSGLFGGNSNWRGPVWVPMNLLLIEALERYHYFYGDELRVECPTGSGTWCTLAEVAVALSERVARLFLPDTTGARPCHGAEARYRDDPHFRDLVLFYEYFHGDDGRGLGASHQTGWTALVTECLRRT
ncbi:MAG: glucosidase [Bryobacterales bacterium]